ncbi:uncharacterized protein MELLADRAFT_84734 [Melampsora larici-populina 98AG31]|uniref:CxC5 like cysteine cluster associated with KDZ domain-containing protein n=1 Tax=Melampsora larici-populina (strain 98AG31 / pathotype 3-4-7) TaxID=747676 RepID=F4RG32_MELLP|nr:uncharacterized protein MELLADRAFT_84734 [Melampsora larici-populina 98AG31]EGG08612.1 hypothetical protein MELLADRAFT_84734 [Melampsora larici-populina 98AG31]
MLLTEFVAHLTRTTPQLSTTLTVGDFVRFMSLASEVQQRAGQGLRLRSYRLPVAKFFLAALKPAFLHPLIRSLWSLAWDILPSARIDSTTSIRELGVETDNTSKVAEQYLRAPVSRCLVCPNTPKLHVHSRLNAYVFDSDGVHTAETTILRCPDTKCATSYRPSYYTREGLRCYYNISLGRDPDILQVHCHYYMTRRLHHMLRGIQLLAHVSHFNLVNWYNRTFFNECNIPQFASDQAFSPAMSEAVCSDGLDLLSLLDHADRRGTQLTVSASGTNHLRFEDAMGLHLDLLAVEGTRDRDHYCSRCVRIQSGGIDSETGEEILLGIRAVVTDGLTIGHWRCSATTNQLAEMTNTAGLRQPEGPCTNRLENINHRFCKEHFHLLGNRCQAQPCTSLCEPGSRTCKNEAHISAMQAFEKRVEGSFSLTAILNRPGSNLPSDATVHLNTETGEFEDLESLQQADESNRAHERARDGGESQQKDKVCLSRMRTHNDQLIVGRWHHIGTQNVLSLRIRQCR